MGGSWHAPRPWMSAGEAVAILAAGIAAGTINTVVGTGTLITFPVLLAFGYRPVVANVSNTVGLVPGAVAGAQGYRAELATQRRRLLALGLASTAGGLTGALLLLTLPDSAFKAIVPAFILVALVAVLAQPRLAPALAARRAHAPDSGRWTGLLVYAAGVYGGYFGAAQGVLLLAILGLSWPHESLQRVNALKIVLVGLANLIAGIVFVIAAHVAWAPAGLIAGGSLLGGIIGSRVGRRLPPAALRALIVAVGSFAIVHLLV